jgi:hypothetical protein
MNGHGELVSIPDRYPGDNPSLACGFEPSPREKPLNVGADLVRQVFRDFEFHFRVSGIHLNNSG